MAKREQDNYAMQPFFHSTENWLEYFATLLNKNKIKTFGNYRKLFKICFRARLVFEVQFETFMYFM